MKSKIYRFNVIKVFLILFFLIIILRLFYINIIKHDNYDNKLNSIINGTIEGPSAQRGRIYDRNHKLLVDNVGIKSLYYKRKSNIDISEEINIALKLSEILNLNYNNVTEYMLKELWLKLNYSDDKITEEEWNNFKMNKLSNEDIINLKMDRITSGELKTINKKQAYIFYLMNNGYSYEEKLIKKDVSEEEYAIINENLDEFSGIIPKLVWERKYLYGDTLRGILGNVSSIETGVPMEFKDYYLNRNYKLTDRVGISGLELQYDDYLRGQKAVYKSINNNLELIEKEKIGNDIILSIDIDLQLEIDKIIEKEMIKVKNEPNTEYFNKAFAVISDPNTGEVLALSAKKIDNGKVYDYSSYLASSAFTVGSVIKGASISVGYKTKVIDIGTILKDECVKLLNTPYKCSWNRNGLGYINDVNALRLSSNVYQFKIAMMVSGFDYTPNGYFDLSKDPFSKYRNMFNSYGLGVKTGIDLPYESIGLVGTNDTPGLILDFSIGQYDTYTPLQLSQYINTIANDGERLKLNLVKQIENNGEIIYEYKKEILNKVDLDKKYIDRIKEGFKSVLSYNGTGYGYIDLRYNPAGKTGTSQSFFDSDYDGYIDKETISSTFAGFAPYDDPKMSVVVVTPDVSHIYGANYLSTLNKRISNQISKKYFEFYK